MALVPAPTPTITPDQMALITKTVAAGATADELKLYLYDCARHGVHPLDRLIHFTKRGGKYTPVTSIDFMRTRAADSGEMAGSDDPVFHPSVMGSGDTHPLGATVTVYRLTQGQRFAYSATARWSEYKPDVNDFMWKKMPHTMLGKCAEALALRKGFPKQLAGLYAREEMEQADAAPGLVVEAPKPPETVNQATGEVVQATPKTEPGAAYHWIVRCEDLNGKGKKKGTVTFTDGTVATVWMSDAQLFDVCLDLCQKAARVVPTFQHKEGYPPTLKKITPFISDEDAQAPSREQDIVPPITVDPSQAPF